MTMLDHAHNTDGCYASSNSTVCEGNARRRFMDGLFLCREYLRCGRWLFAGRVLSYAGSQHAYIYIRCSGNKLYSRTYCADDSIKDPLET